MEHCVNNNYANQTRAFSKTFVFAVHTMHFHLKTHAFSKTFIILVWTEGEKCIEKDAFSNENALVWTEPQCHILQR